MAGGLIVLAAQGKESMYITYKPEITLFKVQYKRHTNFAIEPIEQPFKNTPSFGSRVTSNISQNADLISNTYVVVDLPSIFPATRTDIPNSVKKFSWVKKLGWVLIRAVELDIDGILIDRHLGEWLNIWSELSVTPEKRIGLNKMIGNITELTDLTNGKKTYRLQIPLSFWFCNYSNASLPLIALLHNDIKIHVDFNDFNLCHIVSPTHYIKITDKYVLFEDGETMTQNVDNIIATGEFVHFDTVTNKLFYNQVSGTFNSWTEDANKSKYILTGENSKFTVTPTKKESNTSNVSVKDLDYFSGFTPSIENAHLLINYIYLDSEERVRFILFNHEYLVQTIQQTSDIPVFSHFGRVKLNFVNPCIEIIWRTILKSNQDRNLHFEYETVDHKNIIDKATVLIDGHIRVNEYQGEFYSDLQNYIYHKNSSSTGLNMYSFSINPEDYQPSGSLNFSKVKDVTLEVTFNKSITYQNTAKIQVFARSYNILRIINKRAGLAYAS
jgi:hypothetical protein